MTIINEEKKYRKLKESFRMLNSQRSNVEKISFSEERKKMSINEAIWQNEIIHIKMKSYCLKWKKDTENINPRISNASNGRRMILSKCGLCGSKN